LGEAAAGDKTGPFAMADGAPLVSLVEAATAWFKTGCTIVGKGVKVVLIG
jgi:hypothetical protein